MHDNSVYCFTTTSRRSFGAFLPLLGVILVFVLLVAACGGEANPEFVDSDGDLIVDADDACQDAPETVNGYKDRDGCPDKPPAAEPVPGPYAGTWTGDSHLLVPSNPTVVHRQAIAVSVSADGWAASIRGFCPDGTGSLSLTSFDGVTETTSIYACPPGQWGECPRANILYYGLRLSMDTDDIMMVEAEGAVTLDDLDDDTSGPPCNITGQFTYTFHGRRS